MPAAEVSTEIVSPTHCLVNGGNTSCYKLTQHKNFVGFFCAKTYVLDLPFQCGYSEWKEEKQGGRRERDERGSSLPPQV